ncbi:hypothetical protein E2C01_014311 [Portunus trituberculatus]|uniref:Uncharacterized protein n=1 Tax=Portunus trituberculatus TaxID=210409 RepID=A0A5B7DIV1_PORTR|nr:hypothetical protein [Portunus trituberculatus]
MSAFPESRALTPSAPNIAYLYLVSCSKSTMTAESSCFNLPLLRIIELVHPSSIPLTPLHSAWLRWQSDYTSPCTCKPIVRDKCCVSLNTPRHMGKRVQQPATTTSKHVKVFLPLHSPQAAAAAAAPSLCHADPTICRGKYCIREKEEGGDTSTIAEGQSSKLLQLTFSRSTGQKARSIVDYKAKVLKLSRKVHSSLLLKGSFFTALVSATKKTINALKNS